MNRLGLAAIGYTPDDKVPRPDEGEIGEKSLCVIRATSQFHLPVTDMFVCFYLKTRLLE